MRRLNSALLNEKQAQTLELPEKVLQFGTGVLLRGLPDYFIDKANKQGIFNGRIVVVKSTDHGGTDDFELQDGLYTHCIRGVEDGNKTEDFVLNSSISRVLSAKNNWEEILKCAENPDMQVIISNTTEVGIRLEKDNVHGAPPSSFPGKLLSFLYHRFRFFNGDNSKGMVIIPTELLPNNGTALLSIVLELSHQHGFEVQFIDWLENANTFCNSLVDRIVPGKLPAAELAEAEATLGYTDSLMIMSEVYRLWAIETDNEKVKQVLSFADADSGVVIAPDIEMFRELKLRLLNGSHTFSCGMAYLVGCKTVREGMQDALVSDFIQQLMIQEMLPVLEQKGIGYQDAYRFAQQVMDRFRNPYLAHEWINITVQYSSKMRMRNVQLLEGAAKVFGEVPVHMVLGFAAYLLFMRTEKTEAGKYMGSVNGQGYEVNDAEAPVLYDYWKQHGIELVAPVLEDERLWGTNLRQLPGFATAVKQSLELMTAKGVREALLGLQTEKIL